MNKAKLHISKSKTNWVKFAQLNPEMVCLVGKDILCISGGCHILIYSILTLEEVIVSANGEKRGEGVGCVTGHRSLNILAYAEKKQYPRLFLVNCPEAVVIQEMKVSDEELLQLSFSEGEILLVLSGFPNCFLNIYNWRTGQHLGHIDSKMIYINQILQSGYTVVPLHAIQIATETNLMQLWEISVCGQKCITRQEMISPRNKKTYFEWLGGLWTTDGAFFCISRYGKVFKLANDNRLDLVIDSTETGPKPACFAWYKGGLIIQGPSKIIRHWEKKEEWTNDWNLEQHKEIIAIRATMGRDRLIVITPRHQLLYYDWKNQKFEYLRSDESNITYFDIIYPLCKLFVTIGQRVNLSLWDATTGKIIESELLAGKANGLHSNPEYPYFGVFFVTGLLRLFSCLDNSMMPLCSFQLTRLPLHRLKYFENSNYLVTGNMDIGQLFVIKGKPGGKFKIFHHLTHNAQICDYIAVGSTSCFRIFFIEVTQEHYNAGNKIVRYCLIEDKEPIMKVYDIENPDRLYSTLYVSLDFNNRDRLMFAIPLDNKNLHELEVKRGDTHARIIRRIKTGHMMRLIRFKFLNNEIISYGYDGLVIWRKKNFEMISCTMPHHRNEGGVNRLEVNFVDRTIFTFGRDKVIVCSTLEGHKKDEKAYSILKKTFMEMREMFDRKSIGFTPKGKYEGKCFLEYHEMVQFERERLKYTDERQKILDDVAHIRKKAVLLLSKNLQGPENERLDIQDFNLNLAHKEESIKSAKLERERMKNHFDRLISEQDRVSKFIIDNFWKKVDAPTKNLHAIFGNFDVQNYCELHPDVSKMELLKKIESYRDIEILLKNQDSFEPWHPYNEKEVLTVHRKDPSMTSVIVPPNMDDVEEEDEDIKRKEAEFETLVAYFGSTIPMYFKPNLANFEQLGLSTFYQQNLQCAISLDEQARLREYFNKEFESVVQIKIKEMSYIIERNARLRYIISELNYFSEQQLDIHPENPVWRQDERPEEIIKVEDSEVSVLPYISPSEQAILNAKAAEEERIRLGLLADDFKERALMKMMNGVLESRWEDELRKEVPLPKCMKEKHPDDFNEDDLRLVNDYEEKCAFLKSERARYKEMLEQEYNKIGSQLREGVKKFNERLEDLLVTKLKIEFAIQNEYLRINRSMLRGIRRLEYDNDEQHFKEQLVHYDQVIEDVQSFVNILHKAHTEVKLVQEGLLSKERQVEKSFKKEFQHLSPAQMEVLVKLYKKRPKGFLKTITSPTVLLELAKALFSGVILPILTPEAVEFLKNLDVLDKYIGISIVIDENTYTNLCKQRRLKIEHELKVKACQNEMLEAENTLTWYQEVIGVLRNKNTEFQDKLSDVREEKVKEFLNVELQLVVKQAFVELPQSGSLDDFKDAILVNREEIESINKVIVKAGSVKLAAMRNAMQFKREISLKEWEHQKKKMQIYDLEHELVDIESVKLTKEIQQFLKSKARGDAETQISFDHEVELMTERYEKMIHLKEIKTKSLQQKLNELEVENIRLNESIAEVNVDVSEAHYKIDENLAAKEKQLEKMRISSHLKRAKLVNQIQNNHQEILVLQAELELCRLRTVPVLDYKVDL